MTVYLYSPCLFVNLTMGVPVCLTAVTAAVVMNLVDVAVDAHISVTAHALCSAITHGLKRFMLEQGQSVRLHEGVTVLVKDVLNRYVAHVGNIS